jgi:hypothetical protein
VVFGKGLQDFEQAFLHADAGLDALHQQFRIVDHVYQCTTMYRYAQRFLNPPAAARIPAEVVYNRLSTFMIFRASWAQFPV